ncbi:MAG TPA: tetratricopeptide repeat protein [Ktedonosporobacter sp.]|nr:tetratricopeptide repeat protein [Ktedonosporobacter sp.]
MRNLPAGTVTLLFTDMQGSTRLLQQLGQRYAELLAECRALLRAVFEQWSGHEVDTQGDAFFVAFPRATDAVAAAVAAQRALFVHEWPDSVEVRVRIGLHTGEPQPAEEGYVGMDVHRAARIMGAAHGGQVLLSQTTSNLVRYDLPEAVTLRDLGAYHLKDVEGFTHLFQIVIPDISIDFPPLLNAAPEQVFHDFPPQLTPFIGREQEITRIGTTLRQPDVRLLTLIGTAGVGKTRLAVQAASEMSEMFRDGIFFIALEQVGTPEGVVPAIAQTLNIQEEKGRPLFERVKSTLREQRALLILDNFEHVGAASLLVINLLAACPHMKALITSRQVLHVQAEHVFDVPPLALPNLGRQFDPAALLQCESIALFVQRAQTVQPGFQLTPANASAVASICTRLDGIPLAIELAAARSRYFPPQVLLARLEQGLAILNGSAHDIPTRQQTLRGALAWSYDLLDAREQEVFRRLAVFVKGGMLDAIEQVGAATGIAQEKILPVLEALVDKSLLQQQIQAEGEMRFWQLQTLREYGLECLQREGESKIAHSAHADYYLTWAEKGAALLLGTEQARWLDRLEQEYDNLRSALEWLLQEAQAEDAQEEQQKQSARDDLRPAERALRLCIAASGFWEIRGHFSEGSAFLERALAISTGVKASVRAEALHQAGFLALVQDNDIKAETLLQQSQELFEESGDRAGMANILRTQGNLARTRSNYKVARRLLEEALAIYEELGNSKRMTFTREDLAQIALAQCNYTTARTLLEENLARYQAQNEKYSIAYPLFHLARTLFLANDDLAQAQILAERSLAIFKTTGNRRFLAYVSGLLGEIHLMRGEEAEARSLLEEYVVACKQIEDRFSTADALMALARFKTQQGKHNEALACYEESGRLLRIIGVKEASAACLEGIGEVAVGLGKPKWAAYVWGTAAEVRASIITPMQRIYRPSYSRAVRAARQSLGDEAFQATWAEGRQVPLEQALLVKVPDQLRQLI